MLAIFTCKILIVKRENKTYVVHVLVLLNINCETTTTIGF